jgi:hypothetical protein
MQKNIAEFAEVLLEALNNNVFLHFDELDSLVSFSNNEEEKVAHFYQFWRNVIPFLKEEFIFCSARQSWFQKLGKWKEPCQTPSGFTRIVLQALPNFHIKDLIYSSPAEDEALNLQKKTIRDQLELYDDEILLTISQEIERLTGGIPRLIDYSIHSLCVFSKDQKISTETIPTLFGRQSELQKTWRNSADVKIMFEQLETKENHPFFALLVWLGYTEIAVDISLSVDFFGLVKLSVSEIADFCCIYLVRIDESKVQIKLPQCFRDFLKMNEVLHFVGLFR